MRNQHDVRYTQVEDSTAPQTSPARTTETSSFQIPRKPVPLVSTSALLLGDQNTTQVVGDAFDEVEVKSSRSKRLASTCWTPFFLRTWVLICFIVLFLALIAALQVLLSISGSHHGIATSQGKLHYLWKYGPTAFFILVTVVWSRVDYQAKQVQPWSALVKGEVKASHSLLIDYITPLFFISFKNALKERHLAIASTILVSILIRALTVISTGLMDLEPIPITETSVKMSVQKAFNESGFLQRQDLGLQPAYEVLCNLKYNLTYGPDLTNQDVVQPFTPVSAISSGTIKYAATVDVMRTDVVCETANVTFPTHFGREDYFYQNISFTTSDCYLPTTVMHNDINNNTAFCVINSTDDRVLPVTWTGSCANIDPGDQDRDRIGFAAYVCGPEGLKATGILCNPSYSVRQVHVTLDPFGNVMDVAWDLAASTRQLPDVRAIDLIAMSFTNFNENSVGVGLTDHFQELTVGNGAGVDAMAVFAILTGPDVDKTTLSDPEYLKARMGEFVPRMMSQAARIYLLTSEDGRRPESMVGTVTRDASRLMVRTLPVRLMQSICGVMSVLTLSLMFTITRDAAPPSILTLGGTSTILARSSQVTKIFRGSGASTLDAIRAVISEHRFKITSRDENTGGMFCIESVNHEDPSSTWESPLKVQWDQPIVLRWWSMSLTTTACIAVLVALEVMLNQSQRHNGIASVQAESLLRYTWTYIPTATLVLISVVFGAISFNLKFAHPYHELAHGPVPASSSLFWNPAGDLSLRTAWRALRKSRYPLLFSCVATLFAPLLSIVASGLFTIQNIPNNTELSLQAEDWFDLPAHVLGNSEEDDGSIIGRLAMLTNLTYLSGTYDELVFPSINFDDILNHTGRVSVVIPALRARLDCHQVPDQDIVNATFANSSFSARLTVPEGCGYETPSTYEDIGAQFKDLGPDGYFSDFGNFYWWSDLDETSWCPTPFFTFYGQATGTDTANVQMYLCSGGVDVLDANVTFDLPSLYISRAPILDESTRRNFSSWENRDTILSTWTDYGGLNASFVDAFTYAAVLGRDAVTAQQMQDPDIYVKQLQHVYRQHAAQVINHVYRDVNASKNSTLLKGVQLDNLSGVYIDTTNTRLVQSAISTRILDAILGILIICSIVIFFTFSSTGIMPKPMGSLAAVISLLADSRILDESNDLVPMGSEWLSSKEMQKRGLWKNEEFSMRWWDVKESERQALITRGSVSDESSAGMRAPGGSRVLHIDSRPRGG